MEEDREKKINFSRNIIKISFIEKKTIVAIESQGSLDQ